MKLSHRIRQLRYAKGWGPDDLASRANISRTALYQIESGKTGLPRAATLRRIARALGVAPENLLSSPETEAPAPAPPAAQATSTAPSATAAVEPSAEFRTASQADWLRDFELERKFRILLNSPLRDAVSRIVEETFRLLPTDAHEQTG